VKIVFNAIKPLLDPKTLGKVSFLSSFKEVQETIGVCIHESELPVRLGGTRKSNVEVSFLKFFQFFDSLI